MKKLSILIATIQGREQQYEALRAVLDPQLTAEVEVLSMKDNKQISIGAKRQRLLEAATGEYVCSIDDDDTVPKYYVSELLKAIESKPDCVGFLIDCDMEGVYRSAIASLKYKEWSDGKDGYYYNRSIYHKTPVKRDIALQVGFPDLRYAEDHAYAMGLQPLLKTESFINRVMYYYRYSSKVPHNQKYGIQ